MFYRFVKLYFAPLVHIYLRLRVEGRESIPPAGPAILVANHASFLDPIVLGSACPRKVHFVVLQSMHDWWRLRWFYWGMQTIPVKPQEGDAKAIRRAVSKLKEGHVVGLFPEGGRSLDGILRDEGKMGAALLAALSGAPVIPCYIEGAYDSLPPRGRFPRPARVIVRFGEKLEFQGVTGGKRDRAGLERFSSLLLSRIAGLKEGFGESLPGGRRERAASPRLPGNP